MSLESHYERPLPRIGLGRLVALSGMLLFSFSVAQVRELIDEPTMFGFLKAVAAPAMLLGGIIVWLIGLGISIVEGRLMNHDHSNAEVAR